MGKHLENNGFQKGMHGKSFGLHRKSSGNHWKSMENKRESFDNISLNRTYWEKHKDFIGNPLETSVNQRTLKGNPWKNESLTHAERWALRNSARL